MPMVKLIAEFLPKTQKSNSLNETKFEILYPSTIVKNYFKRDEKLSAREFLKKALLAMNDANNRVIEKYGYACFGCNYYLEELENIIKRRNLFSMDVTIKELLD